MKNLIILIWLILSSVVGFSQTTFPIISPMGSTSTMTRTPGTFATLTGFTWGKSYEDTTAANVAAFVKYTPGIVIRCGTDFYVRNETVNLWTKINGSGGGGFANVQFGITAVNSTTIKADTTSSGLSSYYLRLKDSANGGYPIGYLTPDRPLGDIVNTSFSSITGFTKLDGAATITFSSGLNGSGGNGNYNNNYVKSTYHSTSNNYGVMTEFTVNTKPATPGEGFVVGKLTSSVIQLSLYVTFVMTDATHARLRMMVVNGTGNGTAFDSTATVALANTNNYRVSFTQSGNTIYFRLARIASGVEAEIVDKLYTIPANTPFVLPNTGDVGVIFLGGSYKATLLRHTDFDVIFSDVLVVGTSITQGYYPSSGQSHYLVNAFRNTNKKYVNFGAGGNRFADVYNYQLTEIYALHPKAVGLELGVNDNCSDIRNYAPLVIDSLQAHGIEVFWIQDFTNSCKDSMILNICNEQGITLINPGATMTADMYVDGVHPNDFGFAYMAKFLKANAPQYFGATGITDQYAMRSLKDINPALSPSDGDFLTYSTSTRQWSSGVVSGFIKNQTSQQASASFNIDGAGSMNFLGVGAAAAGTYRAEITRNTTGNGQGLLFNNSSASGSNGELSLSGASASFGSWQNSFNLISYVSNGITLSSAGAIRFDPGTFGTTKATLNNTGLFLGGSTLPTHQLTVNGQIKVFAPQAGDIDSVATWKDGVLSSTLASSIVGAVPTWPQTAAAGSTFAANLTGVLTSAGTNYIDVNGGVLQIGMGTTPGSDAGINIDEDNNRISIAGNGGNLHFDASTNTFNTVISNASTSTVYGAQMYPDSIVVGRLNGNFLRANFNSTSVTFLGSAPVISIGGITSSFPMITNNGADLAVRLADNSAGASIQVSGVKSLATTFNLATTNATTINIGDANAAVISFGAGTSGAETQWQEPSASGSNYFGLKAQAMASNQTYLWPAAVGAAGSVLTDAAGNGTLSWAAAGGGGWGTTGTVATLTGAANLEIKNGASLYPFSITQNGDAVFSVDPVNGYILLDPVGNGYKVGINVTTPTVALEVDANTTGVVFKSTAYPAGLFIVDNTGSLAWGDIDGAVNNTNINLNDGSGTLFYKASNGHTFATGTVTISNLSAGGAVTAGAGTGTLSVVSDPKVKHDINLYQFGLKQINATHPITFRYNEDQKMGNALYAGFNATEVYNVYGSLGAGTTKEGLHTLFDRAILAAAVNGEKQLYEMVVDLTKRIEVLEKENKWLKKNIK